MIDLTVFVLVIDDKVKGVFFKRTKARYYQREYHPDAKKISILTFKII